LNTLYLYNYIDGQLKNIPDVGTGAVYVRIYSGSANNTEPSGTNLQLSEGGDVVSSQLFYVTGGYESVGIYTASLAITASTTPLTKLFDVWQSSTGVEYFTGSIIPKERVASQTNPTKEYVTTVQNLKFSYNTTENARFRIFTRPKNWNPNLYVKATSNIENTVIEDAYYKIIRVQDDFEVIPYGTGSEVLNYTRMSYDVSGNYFDLDISLLQKDAMYGLKFSYYVNGDYQEQPETFTFRVES
jgi:hypothetical protein